MIKSVAYTSIVQLQYCTISVIQARLHRQELTFYGKLATLLRTRVRQQLKSINMTIHANINAASAVLPTQSQVDRSPQNPEIGAWDVDMEVPLDFDLQDIITHIDIEGLLNHPEM